MEHIILAFSSDTTGGKIRSMFEGSGYLIHRNICHSGAELLRTIQEYDEALVIMGFKLPDMTANEMFEHLEDGFRLMSIVKPENVEYIEYDDILVVPIPVSRQRLVSSVNVFLGNIPGRRRSVRSGEDNKIIEQAKLFLMETYHMSEQQAHRFMQKRSMDVGAKLIDTARTILNMDE